MGVKKDVKRDNSSCFSPFTPHSLPFTAILLLIFNFQFSIFNSQFSIFNSVSAQDIHFSQIDVNPVIYNPAYAGFFDGGLRLGLAYRNQWATVSHAFQTVAATAECSLMRRRYYRDGLSLGMILYNDRAGTLQYGSTAGNIALSYFKALGNQGNNFISLALQGGGGQAGFNTADIDMQDPSDLIATTSATFITVAAGIAWFYQPNDDLYFKLSLGGHNLNRPNISYSSMTDAFLERRYNVYARAEYRAWSNVSLLPLAICMIQNNYSETMFGCDVKWYLSESSGHILALSGGLHYRWRDAALVELTAEWNSFTFALTYDANISKLTPASNSIGSFELGIVYHANTNKRVKRKALPCPVM